ncbi:MAG: PEP-CTERM sorting domain-containing protein [Planctomycetota bacterium]
MSFATTRAALGGVVFSSALALAAPAAHAAGVSADGEVVVTITLTDIVITDTSDSSTRTPGEFDLEFIDVFTGGSTASGSLVPGDGSGSGSQSATIAGVDSEVFDIFEGDTFSIGDSVVITQNVSAMSNEPGVTFFGQVDSETNFYFETFLNPDDQASFFFDVTAELTGDLLAASPAGNALIIAEGKNVEASADSADIGDPTPFTLFGTKGDDDRFYDLFALENGSDGPADQSESTSFEVTFEPGENFFSITINTGVVANATLDVPEPASLALLSVGLLAIAGRRRARSIG